MFSDWINQTDNNDEGLLWGSTSKDRSLKREGLKLIFETFPFENNHKIATVFFNEKN